MTNMYVSIGNSDDKLTQREWSEFVIEVDDLVLEHAVRLHGTWFSRPDAPWQNANWCLELDTLDAPRPREDFLDELLAIGHSYRQDTVAIAEAEPQLLACAK